MAKSKRTVAPPPTIAAPKEPRWVGTPAVAWGPPLDLVRLGSTALSPVRGADGGRDGVLLVAAALLLAVAAGGSAVLGIAARSAAPHA